MTTWWRKEGNVLILNVIWCNVIAFFSPAVTRSGNWRALWWTWTTRPCGMTTASLSLSTTVWWSHLSCRASGKEVRSSLQQCDYTTGKYHLFLRIVMTHGRGPSLTFVIFCLLSILSTRWDWIPAAEDRGSDNVSWKAHVFRWVRKTAKDGKMWNESILCLRSFLLIRLRWTSHPKAHQIWWVLWLKTVIKGRWTFLAL